MLTGLDILIARMKTNPEEFLIDKASREDELGGKWSDLINYAGRVANEEERQALEDAIKEMHRDDFNERVMKRLAGEEVKQTEQPSPYVLRNSVNSVNAMQNAATHQQMMQNAAIQRGGFGQAQIKQEGGGFFGLGNSLRGRWE